jgi:hypothetical protein
MCLIDSGVSHTSPIRECGGSMPLVEGGGGVGVVGGLQVQSSLVGPQRRCSASLRFVYAIASTAPSLLGGR